tara:strand:- start:4636 stop:6657 length:2022 start_codon:yes stop_codon:yes gene_type:complete
VRIKYNIIIALFCFLIPFELYAVKEYDWDGSSSTAWNTSANWDPAPGTGTGTRVYIVGGPGTYTNAPNMNATATMDIDYLDFKNGAQVTISGGSSDVDNDMAVYNGSDVTISGGTLTIAQDLHIYDAGSSVTVSGGNLVVTGTLYLGLQHPSRSDGTNGTPTLTVSSGKVTCGNLVFDDAEGDTPALVISGGEVEVTGDLRSDGADVDITISSSGLLDINDDLEMDGGSDDLTMSNGTLTLAGDWINTGSTSLTGGTITFDGSSAQQITNTSGETFYNFTVNNTSTGITLNDPLNITSSVVFTDGVVNTTSTNYLNFTNNATVSGASSSSYVDGPVRKTGDDAFVFPVGDGGNYQPLTISAPSGASEYFTAQYYYTDPSAIFGWGSGIMGTGLDHASTREFWQLDRSGSTNINLTLPWNSNSGSLTDLSKLRLVHWTGSQWEDLGGSITGNTSAGTITVNGVSSYSPFTLGSTDSASNPLPVELIHFEASATGAGVVLNWKTSSEINSSHFVVERRLVGGQFVEVGTVMSKSINGTSNKLLEYDFVDVEKHVLVYYRIKQVDINGQVEYSGVRLVERNNNREKNEFVLSSLYPNPVSSDQGINIDLDTDYDLKGAMNVKLLAMDGRLIYHEEIDFKKGKHKIDLPKTIAPGNHIIFLSCPEIGYYESVKVVIR